MEEKLQKLKKIVCDASENPNFVHHKWFVEWHLLIVEKIALELCEKYPEADRDVVLALVWIHDYAKILDKSREHEREMMEKAGDLLEEVGFDESFVDKVFGYLVIFESKMESDLAAAPIEVQIASSADAASHFFGPFHHIYYYESPDKTVEFLTESNMKKINKDWDRKISLPEVKEMLEARYKFTKEQAGQLPERFFA